MRQQFCVLQVCWCHYISQSFAIAKYLSFIVYVLLRFPHVNVIPSLRINISNSKCQVVPGTRRGGNFEKETWFIGIRGELERSKLK